MAVNFNASSVNYNPNFKGSMKRTEQGNPYYKTNSGTKIGAGFAALTLLSGAGSIAMGNFINKAAGNLGKELTQTETVNTRLVGDFYKKLGKYSMLVGIPMYLGCGMIVDYLRNQKAKKAADLVHQAGIKNAMIQDRDIAISPRRQPYLNSDSGAKNGAILGAVVNPLATLILWPVTNKFNQQFFKSAGMSGMPKMSKVPSLIMSCLTGAFGGWLLGKWADHNSNKAAEKYS